MIVTLRTPIGDIVAKQPRAAAVFEQHQIDYCCEGDQPLQAACHRAKADAALVLDQILRAAAEALEERDWTSASLADLSGHIVSVHHAFMRRGLAALASRLAARGKSGTRHGDLGGLQARFEALQDGLEPHLRVEEQRVFPAIVRAEEARLETRPRPGRPNASLATEIAHLGREHRLIDTSLRQLCRTAAGELEADVLQEIAALQADVHRHLHLENNILFPRATALEESYA
jgi:regulator of cell morphogenesis and NO signaling